MMILSKAALDYILRCDSIGEARAFLRGMMLNSSNEETPKVEAPPAPKVEKAPKYEMRNRGTQAGILRVLYTGTASVTDLVEELKLEYATVKAAIDAMESAGLIQAQKSANPKNPRLWALTEEGKPKAKYFVDNPEAKLFSHKA